MENILDWQGNPFHPNFYSRILEICALTGQEPPASGAHALYAKTDGNYAQYTTHRITLSVFADGYVDLSVRFDDRTELAWRSMTEPGRPLKLPARMRRALRALRGDA